MSANGKVHSPAELLGLAENLQQAAAGIEKRILVCSTGCLAAGAGVLADAFEQQIAAAGLAEGVRVVRTGCHGICAMAPVIVIEPHGRPDPEDIVYGGLGPDDVPDVIESTVQGGQVIDRFCYRQDPAMARMADIPFYAHQDKRVLRHCGRIDPRRIEDAIGCGTYQQAAKALTQLDPDQIVEQVTASGLRGRGGAGFPTGVKWGLCRKNAGERKVLICNADEGDPGAFMDRALLEGDPHRVLEGMLIAARAIGCTEGFIYVRAEYPIAVKHIGIALEQARRRGLLGENILGSGFDFDIEVREGAGAFVCGEESALIASLEGQRGMPRPRPPFPAEKGYLGYPTNINNVETFGNVPSILADGADAYAAIGTEGSKGTKIFALAGKVNNTGLVEVPMGATVRRIVFDIGGGMADGRQFKAVQMGGPSGGCVPAAHLDMGIDYDSVRAVGAIMGSGGMIVMDDTTCAVDIARYFLSFVQEESCGKCTPCRIGTRRMLEILERICDGQGRPGDIEKLESLAKTTQAASLCGLGQTGPNPVLSTLRHFPEEYRAHVEEKRCPAAVCNKMLTFTIDEEECIACGACKKACPVDAILGEKKVPHEIVQALCIHCGSCFAVCPSDAVQKQ